ncbi:glycosyltransferase [Oribacterium sp. WCC10]|uniref:glycosyltransferase n=1 Tax=Oribacterium sp. WCC10 TaxID=1855343 RepID=UPI0008EA9162|nr:glycosyltransferase [Oribacterium sp. WCC10]SFG25472.1 N-acetylgalactosamine-N,N'-diacetylbacillosaminyl-diphospho-undecaprenol 4-alpha-N-acetylgalactosaminyltransferase [Oribacterium sp. WCC10]
MKNIAIITTSLNSGGAERIAGLLSKELSNYYNVYLFLLSTENIIYEYGGTIVDIGVDCPLYEHLIKRYKEYYKIDVAISFLEIMNFANIRTKGKEKVIISERCVQSLIEPSLDAQTYKMKKYYNYADVIVPCAYGVQYDLEKNYSLNNYMRVIYNFINKEKIKDLANCELDKEIRDFIGDADFFLNIGRLDPQKNQLRIIEAFEEFYKKNNKYKLIILGSGRSKKELEAAITRYNLTDKVKLLPYENNPFKYMSKAKALLLASRYEGLPNAVLEAMTVGCPVIATDCLSGPRELLGGINDYNEKIDSILILDRGILVPFFSNDNNLVLDDFISAMNIITKDDDLVSTIINNQRNYMERYSNNKIAKEWIELIDNNVFNYKYINADDFDKAKRVLIYGKGLVGTMDYHIFRDLGINIDGFVVTDNSSNESQYLGLPLYSVDNMPFDNDDVQFVLGAIEETQSGMLRSLNENNYFNIVEPFIEPTEKSRSLVKEWERKKAK